MSVQCASAESFSLQTQTEEHLSHLLGKFCILLLQVAFLSPYVQREVLHHGRGFSAANPIMLPSKVAL